MATWFTADTHFGHENIIRYCGRPYRSAADMDWNLIRRWNERVAEKDVVYHLGDFALWSIKGSASYLPRLRGRKILVVGNHDRKPDVMRAIGFEEVFENAIVDVAGVRCWINYPPRDDFPKVRVRPAAPGPYDLALCGHIHEKWLLCDAVVNVGVDQWGFALIALEAILRAAAIQNEGTS